MRPGPAPASFYGRVAAIHLALRAAVLLAILLWVGIDRDGSPASVGSRLGAALGKSDGVWYLSIAHHGYGPPPPIGPDGVYTHLTSLAFFPLYPMLVRAVAWTHLPYLGAALLVTAVAALAASLAIAAWARPLIGDRGALALVVIWGLFPSNAVLDMAYSEALFVAAAAGCLLALQRRHWIAAGLAAVVAGLTRPTAGAVVAAVWIAAALDLRRTRRLRARPVAAALLAPVGLLVSLAHVAVVTGRWDGWFWLERTVWQSGFDGGWTALGHVGQVVTGGRALHRLPELVAAVVVCAVAAGAAAAWLRAAGRERRVVSVPDAGYGALVAVLAIGERGYFYVKPRLLFVGFPLLTPLARRAAAVDWARARTVTVAVLVAIAAVGYEAYLVVEWPKAL